MTSRENDATTLKNNDWTLKVTLQDQCAVVIAWMTRARELSSPYYQNIVNNVNNVLLNAVQARPTQEHPDDGQQSRQRDFAANGINCMFLILLFVGAVHALGCFVRVGRTRRRRVQPRVASTVQIRQPTSSVRVVHRSR
ncbi:hypothetical protein PENSPDRAFT_313930 [Peniophora sp. CONT]|nr:hypothetical protein PENSPDRAFT_313930 [Peniophora sp. CONT]